MAKNTRFGNGLSGFLFAALVAVGGCAGPLDSGGDTPSPGGEEIGEPEPASTSSALVSQTINSNWQCQGVGQSCEDAYDVSVSANTRVTIRVTSVTGSSVLRLGAYGPNSTTGGNLLTGNFASWGCTNAVGAGRDRPQEATFLAPVAGTYRLVVGRDVTTSAGANAGTYSVTIEGNPSMSFLGQTANDARNFSTSLQCGFVQSITSIWHCPSTGCQNVYDFDVQANTTLNLTVGTPSGNTAIRTAVFSPGKPLSGPNMLTGRTLDRNCRGVNIGDSTRVVAATAGRYRIAVGRDPALSSGNDGKAEISIGADKPLSFFGITASNAATGEAGAACNYEFFTPLADWICPTGVTCQDAWDFTCGLGGTNVTAAVASVTGGSRVRLHLFGTDSLTGTNFFNGTNSDRACVGANSPDSATSSGMFGLMRLAVGRDAGSGGTSGLFSLRVTSNNPLTALGRTVNNGISQVSTTTCP